MWHISPRLVLVKMDEQTDKQSTLIMRNSQHQKAVCLHKNHQPHSWTCVCSYRYQYTVLLSYFLITEHAVCLVWLPFQTRNITEIRSSPEVVTEPSRSAVQPWVTTRLDQNLLACLLHSYYICTYREVQNTAKHNQTVKSLDFDLRTPT